MQRAPNTLCLIVMQIVCTKGDHAGERIALEVDGPHHFTANTLAVGGAMAARHRLLGAAGWAVVSVPFFLWDTLDDAARSAWLLQARPAPAPCQLADLLFYQHF